MTDFKALLNSAQYEAASMGGGPALIVAGAGTGKTRTIVYRLAWLLEHGVDPYQILLLTFTRKAASEMMQRAASLIAADVSRLSGGTFHSFAYRVLRQYRPHWLEDSPFTVMDATDALAAVRQCRSDLGITKDRSFPKSEAILSLYSTSRNKEIPVEELLEKSSPHLMLYAADLKKITDAYQQFKHDKKLMDYDDLLFELEAVLMQDADAAETIRNRYRYILVDEYQDTNLVQARLVRLLSGADSGNPASVMAVGDEAQSIYSFRGATVENILEFPRDYPNTKVIKLEENYRSTKPILDVANNLLRHAAEGYCKNLFTRNAGGAPVRVIRCLSDFSQAALVAQEVSRLLQIYQPSEIAVLFRSGYQSFNLEMQLNRLGIRFRKYGGLKYNEAAHVKDLTAYLKLAVNPRDYTSFQRIGSFFKGIGPKTCQKIFAVWEEGDPKKMEKMRSRYRPFFDELDFVVSLRSAPGRAQDKVQMALDRYDSVEGSILERLYPENYPTRRTALDEVVSIAESFDALDEFLAEFTLEVPEAAVDDSDRVVLSTIHSAKGLEWSAVMIIDLANDRFPSRHAQQSAEVFEEERRLMYVACTRAREELTLYAPASVHWGQSGLAPASLSPFLTELDPSLVEEYSETGNMRLVKKSFLSSSGNGPSGYAYVVSGSGGHLPADFANEDRESQMPVGGNLGGRTSWKDDFGEEAQIPAGETAPRSRGASVPDSGSDVGEEAVCVPADSVLRELAGGGIRYCRHRIFGRGRVLGVKNGNLVELEFPGYGRKTIIASYLIAEKEHG